MNENQIENIRHTLAHLLVAAVREIWPGSQNAIGPAIENGFYQDFEINGLVTDADLPKIEAKMRELLPLWKDFERKEVSPDEARKEFAWNSYKTEMINDLESKAEKITFYTSGGLLDLCRGGHCEHPAKEIRPNAFKLSHVAGAYWRGDEKNKMLTRIYGLAFATKDELQKHLTMLEEAKKRDHRKLGAELELFMFHETSPGMPYWLPKGLIIYNELVNYWRAEHNVLGYQEIASPLVNKAELWKISGHWDHYKDDMFIADMGENEIYGIKPMNCPNAMVVFKSMQVSYKDLPLRLSDTDRLHRYERSGTLNGLLRVRSFQQDDSHNFISEEMIGDEYEHIFEICKKFYGIFGLEYTFRLGTRPDKFLGEKVVWDKAEKKLKEILEKSGKQYTIAEGDGAFYGPKIDIIMKDCLGREWQMGTMQLDFQLPQRFELHYTDRDGNKKTPIVVHRVVYGSLERFLGILIEHYAGAFPIWLSPVQAIILPISDNQNEWAEKVYEELKTEGIRVEINKNNETLGKKIRTAEMQKIPYLLVIGDKEIKAKSVAVRQRGKGDIGQLEIDKFVEKIKEEISSKS